MSYIVDPSLIAYYEFSDGLVNPAAVTTPSLPVYPLTISPALQLWFSTGDGLVNPAAVTTPSLPVYPLTSTFVLLWFSTGDGIISLNTLTSGLFPGSVIVPEVTYYETPNGTSSLSGKFPPPIGGQSTSAFGMGF